MAEAYADSLSEEGDPSMDDGDGYDDIFADPGEGGDAGGGDEGDDEYGDDDFTGGGDGDKGETSGGGKEPYGADDWENADSPLPAAEAPWEGRPVSAPRGAGADVAARGGDDEDDYGDDDYDDDEASVARREVRADALDREAEAAAALGARDLAETEAPPPPAGRPGSREAGGGSRPKSGGAGNLGGGLGGGGAAFLEDVEARQRSAALAEENAQLHAEARALRSDLEKLKKKENDRRSSRVARHELSLAQLHDEVYELSSKLVAEGEKNKNLSLKLIAVRDDRDRLKADGDDAKSALVEKITKGATKRKGDSADHLSAYKHVTVVQLVEMRERAMEQELRGRSQLLGAGGAARREKNRATVRRGGDAPPDGATAAEGPAPGDPGVAAAVKQLEEEIAKLRGRLRHSDDEKSSLRQELRAALSAGDDVRALKHKATELLGRGKMEKDLRAKAEGELKLGSRKIAALSDHVEKLMVHLKHEVGAKAQVTDQLKRAEREVENMRLRNATLIKRNNVREKFMLELKEGSKILEDQLRLMDRRYLELRAKLDWTRHHADRQVKKAKAAASTLRAKWALATNSQQGLLDNVPLPDTLTPGQSQLSASAGPSASVLSGQPELDEIPSNRKQTRFASMSAGKRG